MNPHYQVRKQDFVRGVKSKVFWSKNDLNKYALSKQVQLMRVTDGGVEAEPHQSDAMAIFVIFQKNSLFNAV